MRAGEPGTTGEKRSISTPCRGARAFSFECLCAPLLRPAQPIGSKQFGGRSKQRIAAMLGFKGLSNAAITIGLSAPAALLLEPSKKLACKLRHSLENTGSHMTPRWRKADSNPWSLLHGRRFREHPSRLARIRIPARETNSFTAGDRRFDSAFLQRRVSLSPVSRGNFAFLGREAGVFRGCAGRGERRGRQRRAGRGNIGPTGGKYLCRAIFQYRAAGDVGSLTDGGGFEFGLGSGKTERGPLIVPGERQT